MKKAFIREVCLTYNLKPATWNPFFGTDCEPCGVFLIFKDGDGLNCEIGEKASNDLAG
jgi:hypothetical protein